MCKKKNEMNHEKILTRKLTALFSDKEERDAVTHILSTYGEEKHEQEPYRVRLAILKLSKADIEEIRKTTKYAKQDFRDILTWAEYPRQSKKWSMPDGPKKQKLVDEDRKEYKEWANT